MEDLAKQLRERDARFESLKPAEFLDPDLVYTAVAAGRLDDAIALVCGKYGIAPSRVRVAWVDAIANPGVAAHVRSEPLGPVEITILTQYKLMPAGFGAVIAHELGHAYLSDLGIPNGGGWEEEATTDLVTFLKGLGKLTVNGVAVVGHSEKAGSRCYGYLSREAVVFAYARAAEEYDVPEDRLRVGLNPAALSYLKALQEPQSQGCLGALVALFAAALTVR